MVASIIQSLKYLLSGLLSSTAISFWVFITFSVDQHGVNLGDPPRDPRWALMNEPWWVRHFLNKSNKWLLELFEIS